LILQRIHRVIMQLVLPHLGLPHEIALALLIVPLDTSRFQEVFAEREVLRIVGDGMKTEDGEFKFRVAGVAVELSFVGSDVTHEAVDVLYVRSVKVKKEGEGGRTLIITSKNLREPLYW
jgi:hypothetical protein